MIKPKVLFLCTENSSRTQMAEGLLRNMAGERFEVTSAGGDMGPISPAAVAAMKEVGVDITTQTSKDVAKFFGERFTYVVHLCDRQKERACPDLRRGDLSPYVGLGEPEGICGWGGSAVTSKSLLSNMDKSTQSKKRVLILCTGNSARSQMAEGLLRHDSRGRFEVESAGTKPSQVRTEAISVMQEIGIGISGQRSKSVDEFADQNFDFVLTVCDSAKESCPLFPGHGKRMHHSFEDPAAIQGSEEQRLTGFRTVRDQLREFFRTFPDNL